MKHYSVVYRHIAEKDQTKWEVRGEFPSFERTKQLVMTVYQFRGNLIDHGWFVYGVEEDGTMVQLDHDGNPERVCPSG